ncbi:hypothetical protein HN604_03120 [archaeon]|nr:hypothetical protein [archaeon]MBT6183013.1 hypothetical protein [archaeon]MBT6606519.1 hypothetical protein [archaeon]MBT7251316.1 hypothetical protein [archaeon]MBT7661049.1 hypothetical protein [archaeon]
MNPRKGMVAVIAFLVILIIGLNYFNTDINLSPPELECGGPAQEIDVNQDGADTGYGTGQVEPTARTICRGNLKDIAAKRAFTCPGCPDPVLQEGCKQEVGKTDLTGDINYDCRSNYLGGGRFVIECSCDSANLQGTANVWCSACTGAGCVEDVCIDDGLGFGSPQYKISTKTL